MPVEKVDGRVSAQIPAHIFDTISQAAEITGATPNQFLVQAAIEKANAVIEKESKIQLGLASATAFFDAIENPPAPNCNLINAVKRYKEKMGNV
jgi:uncharacterized protein (DUF1778 family)